ncbi:MAG: hypothetical protein WBK67_02920 [Minisyncoccales bacterium]|jgi:hypothetical protein
MTLKDLIKDKGENTLSLSRSVALMTFFILSGGFILTSWKRASHEVFIAYPIGVMIVFVPQLVVRFMNKLEGIVKAWKGGSE